MVKRMDEALVKDSQNHVDYQDGTRIRMPMPVMDDAKACAVPGGCP
jgi:hypothetical protein